MVLAARMALLKQGQAWQLSAWTSHRTASCFRAPCKALEEVVAVLATIVCPLAYARSLLGCGLYLLVSMGRMREFMLIP